MAFPKTTVRNGIIIIITRIMQSCFCHLALCCCCGAACWLRYDATLRHPPLTRRVVTLLYAECTEMFGGGKCKGLILFNCGHKNSIFTNVAERNALKPQGEKRLIHLQIVLWVSSSMCFHIVILFWNPLKIFTLLYSSEDLTSMYSRGRIICAQAFTSESSEPSCVTQMIL